jgi:hypothetical protein
MKIKKVKCTKYMLWDPDTEISDINDINGETAGNLSDLVKKVGGRGVEIEETIKMMPRLSLYEKTTNLGYLNELIKKLSNNKTLLLPAFLLRAQLIEFALKHLLMNYPYPPQKGYGKKSIESMTMGETIDKLKNLNDNHLNDIIKEADQFKEIRNELTHNILISDKNIDEISKLAEESLKAAYVIERSILFFLTYVQETIYGN